MHPYVLISLAACVVCSAYCLTITPATYDRESRRTLHTSKGLFACAAVWALCEVLWSSGASASARAWLVPLAVTAIVMIGPLAVDLSLSVSTRPHRGLRRSLRWLYSAALGLIVLEWSTGWLYTGLTTVSWGRALEQGPLVGLGFAFIVGCGLVAYHVCRQIMRSAPHLREKLSGAAVLGGILILVVVGSLTDTILPMLGFIETPRLTTTCFAVLAGCILWTISRPQGYIFASSGMISREVLRSIDEGVVFLTLDDRVLLANEGMGDFLGVDANSLLGQPFRHHLPDLPLDEPQQRIDVEAELHPAQGSPITVAASISTARDLRGSPLGLVVVLRDLREVKLLRSRLITSGRLAAVGQLAAGIAHEINNPIAFVRTNLSVLRDHWSAIQKELDGQKPGETLREILDDGQEIILESIEGVDRAARIVRDVREFSHAGQPERETTDLHELLERVIRVAAPELGPNVRIERDLCPVPAIEASPQQLKQVFLNLLVNAIHAVESGGTIRISTEREGDAVAVRFDDDGPGIPADQAERIFDPFFTTKPVGKGTGLGLSISHEIVRNHGGEIGLEPKPGRGTRFCVRLPIEPDAGSDQAAR